MGHYEAGCPKRTKVYSNSRVISSLCRGRLTKKQREKFTIKTTVKTKSGGYQGSKDLKSTQFLGSCLGGFGGFGGYGFCNKLLLDWFLRVSWIGGMRNGSGIIPKRFPTKLLGLWLYTAILAFECAFCSNIQLLTAIVLLLGFGPV